MALLKALLLKYNFPEKAEYAPAVINEIESFVKFTLPDDYKYFLLNFSGHATSIGPAYLRLWGINEILEANTGYEIPNNLPATLGIGSNMGGELIALELCDNGEYRIVLTPFVDLAKTYHIEIGSSFTDFLIRMDSGKEWFA